MALEVYNGTNWIELASNDDLQAATNLIVLATGTASAGTSFTTLDSQPISTGAVFLLTGQTNPYQDGVYTRKLDDTNAFILPQPAGAFVTQSGSVSDSKVGLYLNNAQTWIKI